jgi:hypothetical protein
LDRGGPETVESYTAVIFRRLMEATEHIHRIPGSPTFVTQWTQMKRKIHRAVPPAILERLAKLNVEMAEPTAVKWMITIFTQEFILTDVVRIWTWLIAGGVKKFHERLARLCGRVFEVLTTEIMKAENGDALMEILNDLKGQKPDGQQMIEALLDGYVQ